MYIFALHYRPKVLPMLAIIPLRSAVSSSSSSSSRKAMAMMMILMMSLVSVTERTTLSMAAAKKAGALFVFGDSYADTGNHRNGTTVEETEYKPWRPPYGRTWPGTPTGRYSDGHVFTDFYAKHLRLRKPIPYRKFSAAINNNNNNGTASQHRRRRIGINFAFGGSGVFPTAVFCPNVTTQILQLQDAVVRGFVSTDLIANASSTIALLTVNGNDYTHYLDNNGSLANISMFIQAVVEQMGLDIVSLHNLGFKRLAVSNIAPVGCLPTITKALNFTSCSNTLNGLAALHNTLLQAKIRTLQNQLPNVQFVTLDFFGAFNTTLQSGTSTSDRSKFRACCEGIGDAYCGEVDANGTALYTVCKSPDRSFFWDDFHPTNAAWRNVSALLFP